MIGAAPGRTVFLGVWASRDVFRMATLENKSHVVVLENVALSRVAESPSVVPELHVE